MNLKYYIEFRDTYSEDGDPQIFGRIGWDDKAKKFQIEGKDADAERRLKLRYKEVLEGGKSKEELKKAKNKPVDYLDVISKFYIISSRFNVSDVQYGEPEKIISKPSDVQSS